MEERMEGCRGSQRKSRHRNQNKRVVARMEAEAWKASWAELPAEDVSSWEVSRKFRIDQVKYEKNKFWTAYKRLDKFLSFKIASPDPMPDFQELSFKVGNQISHDMVSWLRDKVSRSTAHYSNVDGSMELTELASILGVEDHLLYLATSIKFDKNGKRRLLVYKEIQPIRSVYRVSALGGHFFPVFSPPGLYPICREAASLLKRAYHRTNAGKEIQRDRVLDAMKRPGGVNFSTGDAPGYRDRASYLITVKLEEAIKKAEYMHNRFSGLIFGMGNWNQENSWWDGKIPVDDGYMTIEKIQH